MSLVCREIFREACILSTGEVVCSCIDAEGVRPLGNVNEERIGHIFLGGEYERIRKEIISSDHTTFCPSLGIDCPFKSIPAKNFELQIDRIHLETYSYCNLGCLACSVPGWIKSKHHRIGTLPLSSIREVLIETKDSLKEIWLYNYGEPFLDKRFLDILRLCREIVPRAFIYTHTNGNDIPSKWIEKIVKDDLLDGISFSIDGASQESYSRYRVGGRFDIAYNNMLCFVENKRKLIRTRPIAALSRILFSRKLSVQRTDNNFVTNLLNFIKTKKQFGFLRPYIVWQYILFEWNDSDEELRKVLELASKNHISMQWLVTHTEGRSQRYLPNSKEYNELQGIKHYSSEIFAKDCVSKQIL